MHAVALQIYNGILIGDIDFGIKHINIYSRVSLFSRLATYLEWYNGNKSITLIRILVRNDETCEN